jgi:hypothetical protein
MRTFKLPSWDQLRRGAVVVALLAGAFLFGRLLHEHYPIQKWLFWRYAGYWLGCAYFGLACLALGYASLKRLLRQPLPALEAVAIAWPLGMFQFELLMFIAGLLKLYHWLLFIVLPLAMIGAGAVPLFRLARSWLRHTRGRRPQRPLGLIGYAIVAFGCVALAMIYFLILSPDNLQFDTRWKHMALAEGYVASGGVRRFPEGWTTATRPHSSSFIYAWAFLLPASSLFDRIELSAHLEYAIFLATTLIGIPALVRRLVPRADPRLIWVARFLFPGVLLYDSSLSAGADHIGAAFAVPLCLLLLRALRELEPRTCIALAALLSAAALVKETVAIMLVPVPIAAVVVRAAMLVFARLRGRLSPALGLRWLTGPAAASAVCLVLTAPHWLKNWIFYGAPFYPVMHRYFTPRPWTSDAAYMYDFGYEEVQMWQPSRDLDGVLATLKALVTFSFVPNDWPQFHGSVPVFGSLFTLLIFCLPFLRGTLRVWALAGWIHVAIAFWYWTHHQDRYLQGIMPLIAAATAAMIVLIWRQTRYVAKSALGGLIGLQVIWGGDVYFIPTHAMVRSPAKHVIDFLGQGYKKKYSERLQAQQSFREIGRATPRDSLLLMHDMHEILGIGRASVSDWPTWQFGISYGLLDSPRAVYELLDGMGVTHVYWGSQLSRSFDTVAGDAMFFDFALKHTVNPRRVGGGTVAGMPTSPPAVDARAFDATVAVLTCNDRGYGRGLYELADMRVPAFGPASRRFPPPRKPAAAAVPAEQLIDQAAFIVLDPQCAAGARGHAQREFLLAAKRKRMSAERSREFELWVRTQGAARSQ